MNLIQTISDCIDKDMIKRWTPEKPVVINAQTGQGKSYFVMNTLYEYLRENNMKCLYLIQRVRTKKQFADDLYDKVGRITLMSYQTLEAGVMNDYNNFKNYDFIICDECHYFTGDSDFNRRTDISFAWIMSQRKSIKVFMSATIDCFLNLLTYYTPVWTQPVRLETNYDYIEQLTFYTAEKNIYDIVEDVLNANKKAILFIQSAELAHNIYEKYKSHMIFFFFSYNKTYAEYMDQAEIEKIISNESFDANILVTTAALDSGLTLKDKNIDTIVVDVLDPETVIQCVGRKRIIDDVDRVRLFIRGRSNQQINGIQSKCREKLQRALLLEGNESRYHSNNERQNDDSGIVVNIPVDKSVSGRTLYEKQYNYAKLSKAEYLANTLYPAMLSEEWGYNKYLARYFGFYDKETGRYTYDVVSPKQKNLRETLDHMTGLEMLTVDDRKPLIDAIHATNQKGKVLKSIDTLNGVLKEGGYPHRIMSYSKHTTINGVDKKYRCVWKIVNAQLV